MTFETYPAALLAAAKLGKPFYTVRLAYNKIILVVLE